MWQYRQQPVAGTIMGGIFLERFVGDIPWAHLDIEHGLHRRGPLYARARPAWVCDCWSSGWCAGPNNADHAAGRPRIIILMIPRTARLYLESKNGMIVGESGGDHGAAGSSYSQTGQERGMIEPCAEPTSGGWYLRHLLLGYDLRLQTSSKSTGRRPGGWSILSTCARDFADFKGPCWSSTQTFCSVVR